MPTLIYKIVPAPLWLEAERSGAFAGSPADERDGFIHFSTAGQLADTARQHFAGQRELLLVTVDGEGLDLRWEPARGGQFFPHLYGVLPLLVVQSVEPYNAPEADPA